MNDGVSGLHGGVRPAARPPAVSFDRVWAGYDGVPALEDVSFDLPDGDFLALVGPNGGGKTTVARLVLGLLEPERGSVRVFGQAPGHVRQRIGYLPQAAQFDRLFPVTVWDVACMGRLRPTWRPQRFGAADRKVVAGALTQVEMLHLRDRPVGTLSGGQLQRALLARALATEPDLLVLDEPAAGLDPRVADELYHLFASLAGRVAIIMASHDIVAVEEHATLIGVVDRGLQLYGPADQAVQDDRIREMPPWASARGGVHRFDPWIEAH